jgi:hypothetical protein
VAVPSQNSRIVDQGLAWLTGGFRSQPNIRAWLATLLQPWQDLEDATWEVLTQRFLATAIELDLPSTNNVFDVIGALVGQPRDGQDDSDYKASIYLRIAVNRSTGRTTDWANFAAILLGAGAGGPVSYYEGRASMFFGVWDENLNPVVIAQSLARAVPNGVYGVYAYSVWPDGNDFMFADANNLTTTGQGTFGDSVAGVVGGLLVSGVALS